jgi:SNF2 family DNA or RNA helicase
MIRAELNERGDRIEVRFPYDPANVAAVKQVQGRRFDGERRLWLVPLSLEHGRELRRVFGDRLELGPALRAWGRNAIRQERNLGKLATADDAELVNVSPEFAEFLDPHQRADVAFLAERNALNGNEPGLGKTEEIIAAVIEAGLTGPKLVSATISTHQETWAKLIRRWLPEAIIFDGETAAEREAALRQAHDLYHSGTRDFWLIVNPDMVRYRRDTKAEKVIEDGKLQHPARPRFPELNTITWDAVIIDEFRKVGLSNRKTLAHKGFSSLRSHRRWALSGTPMGGNPKNLWGVLNWLDPAEYTTMWGWMERWMDSEPNRFAQSGKTFLARVKPGLEDEFYTSLQRHMVRRTRAEVRTNAAPVIHDEWVRLAGKQRKQYEAFAKDAEAATDGQRLEAEGVLAEYTRLRQIAIGEVEVLADVVRFTGLSPKFDRVVDMLAERGITKTEQDGDAKVVIASQWNQVLDALGSRLDDEGVEWLAITGEITGKARNEAQRRFQSDEGPRVILINTTAGGLGIDLDRADTVFILDETWDPDDTTQVEFRIDRRGRTRTEPMDIYYFRTRDTIDEYVASTNAEKSSVNHDILELRRAAFKAINKEA